MGVETLGSKGFNVFPNPGKGVFHMNIEDFDPNASYRVELCTIAGKVVHSQIHSGMERIPLEFSGYSKGLYLVRLIENESIRGVAKLIIE